MRWMLVGLLAGAMGVAGLVEGCRRVEAVSGDRAASQSAPSQGGGSASATTREGAASRPAATGPWAGFQVRRVIEPEEKLPAVTLPGKDAMTGRDKWRLGTEVLLDASAVEGARATVDPALGWAQVEIQLSKAGSKKIGEITRENLHKRLAMVLDGKVITAPTVQTPINGPWLVITGGAESTKEDMAAVARQIMAARKQAGK